MYKSWAIFVIFHKSLFDEHYTCDPSFDLSKYIFVKGNDLEVEYNKEFGYKVIKESNLPFCDKSLQKRKYMASSVVYNIYKNYESALDYIGFLEYDMLLQSYKDGVSSEITGIINEIVNKNDRCIIPLSYRHSFKKLFSQNDIKMNGKNACEQIVLDYNKFYETKFDPNELGRSNDLIVTQSGFICDSETFGNSMKFISHVVENKLCERPNSIQRPACTMDRYIGITLKLQSRDIPEYPLYLKHANHKQW